MRAAVAMIVLACACGKHDAAPGAEAGVIDAPATIDSPPIDAQLFPACATPVHGSTVSTRKLVGKVTGIATLAASPPGDPRVFEVGARGQIVIWKDEQLLATPFLDLSPANGGPVVDTTKGTELGLLGLAFHPSYAQNGIFFVFYTTGDPTQNTLRDVAARCTVSANPDVANPTCTEILSIADPAVNHNAGMMEFGRDGLLYISTGDGGGSHEANSQDTTSLLGKMLRIDVDHQDPGKQYAIPSDNPFAQGGGAPEIFMMGLRNPWRWSFDDATGDMWIADVGESAIEEVDVVAAAEQKGANLGWPMYEGSRCNVPPCDPTGKIFPKDERLHAQAWSAIIGGQVYRGNCYPDLDGWFFYGDFISGAFVEARLTPDRALEIHDLDGAFPLHPTSFHEDGRGELWITDSSGYLYHVEAGP